MHNPGPWTARFNPYSTIITDVEGRRVAEVFAQPNPNQSWDNANLIRLAPQLLVTLRIAVHYLREGGHPELADHCADYLNAAGDVPALEVA